MDKRHKVYQDAEKIVEFIDECVKKGYFPGNYDIMLQLKMSYRMLQPRMELVWQIHKNKPNPTWESVLDIESKRRKEEWDKFDALEEAERRSVEKLDLEEELERTKDSRKRLEIICRLKALSQSSMVKMH